VTGSGDAFLVHDFGDILNAQIMRRSSSAADADVEIVADRGMHKKVSLEEWEKICRTMEAAFKQADYEGGVVSGIRAVTQHLVKHFPASGARRNELRNEPVLL